MKILLLLHGFLGKLSNMAEIEETIKESKDNPFDYIWNINYYDSDYGLDVTKKYSIRTPIYDSSMKDNCLVESLYTTLKSKMLELPNETIELSVIAHSMGGLVIRSLIQNKCSLYEGKQRLFDNCFITNVLLLGTPNHGTLLANKWLYLPVQELIDYLKFIFNLPHSISLRELFKNNSQMAQMETNSPFLKELNNIETIRGVSITTVSGLNNKFRYLPFLWEPFIFWKIHLNSTFPWIHIGQISSDGVVEAKSVPLKGQNIQNIYIKEANHLTMLSWRTENAGRLVYSKVKNIIFNF